MKYKSVLGANWVFVLAFGIREKKNIGKEERYKGRKRNETGRASD